MDFVTDQLLDDRRLRALTLVDNHTRECLAIDIGQNLRGADVVATLGRVCAVRILQWQLAPGVAEQPLVLVICRRQGENRRLADLL